MSQEKGHACDSKTRGQWTLYKRMLAVNSFFKCCSFTTFQKSIYIYIYLYKTHKVVHLLMTCR